MSIDNFDFDDFIEEQKYLEEIVWQYINSEGYIWQDKYGEKYKPEELSNAYLLNILNFCKRSWRPEEQIEKLKLLAKKRGLEDDQ